MPDLDYFLVILTLLLPEGRQVHRMQVFASTGVMTKESILRGGSDKNKVIERLLLYPGQIISADRLVQALDTKVAETDDIGAARHAAREYSLLRKRRDNIAIGDPVEVTLELGRMRWR